MPLDMSDNCQICGANPHEECRFPNMGNHQAINCKINPVAHDSRRDDEMVETRLEHEEEDHPDAVMIFRADSAMTSGDASNPVHSDDFKERLKQNDKKAFVRLHVDRLIVRYCPYIHFFLKGVLSMEVGLVVTWM